MQSLPEPLAIPEKGLVNFDNWGWPEGQIIRCVKCKERVRRGEHVASTLGWVCLECWRGMANHG